MRDRLFMKHLSPLVTQCLDLLQSTYNVSLRSKNAMLILFHKFYHHREINSTCVLVIFLDFSSAFNTIQQHTLIKEIITMKLFIEY